jgi:hypothetical protein
VDEAFLLLIGESLLLESESKNAQSERSEWGLHWLLPALQIRDALEAQLRVIPENLSKKTIFQTIQIRYFAHEAKLFIDCKNAAENSRPGYSARSGNSI